MAKRNQIYPLFLSAVVCNIWYFQVGYMLAQQDQQVMFENNMYSMVNVPVQVYHILCYLLIKCHICIVSTISFMTLLGVTMYLLSLKTRKYAIIFLTPHSCCSL